MREIGDSIGQTIRVSFNKYCVLIRYLQWWPKCWIFSVVYCDVYTQERRSLQIDYHISHELVSSVVSVNRFLRIFCFVFVHELFFPRVRCHRFARRVTVRLLHCRAQSVTTGFTYALFCGVVYDWQNWCSAKICLAVTPPQRCSSCRRPFIGGVGLDRLVCLIFGFTWKPVHPVILLGVWFRECLRKCHWFRRFMLGGWVQDRVQQEP